MKCFLWSTRTRLFCIINIVCCWWKCYAKRYCQRRSFNTTILQCVSQNCPYYPSAIRWRPHSPRCGWRCCASGVRRWPADGTPHPGNRPGHRPPSRHIQRGPRTTTWWRTIYTHIRRWFASDIHRKYCCTTGHLHGGKWQCNKTKRKSNQIYGHLNFKWVAVTWLTGCQDSSPVHAYLYQGHPGYFRELLWQSMELLQISWVTWQFWQWPLGWHALSHYRYIMMTSSSGNIFRVTGHLCGEFTGHRWIPRTKTSDAELWWCFHLRLNKRLSKQWCGWWFETPSRPLWHHCNDVSTRTRPLPMKHMAWLSE